MLVDALAGDRLLGKMDWAGAEEVQFGSVVSELRFRADRTQPLGPMNGFIIHDALCLIEGTEEALARVRGFRRLQ
jgi:hypothetical protein